MLCAAASHGSSRRRDNTMERMKSKSSCNERGRRRTHWMRSRPGSVALSREAAHCQAAERLALPALWIAAAGLVATRVAGGAAGETAAGAGGELGCASI